MEGLLARLYLPAGTAYQKNSTIRRTVPPPLPILKGPTLPAFTDVQALPPPGWCPGCGMEIYRRGANLCSRCGGEADG